MGDLVAAQLLDTIPAGDGQGETSGGDVDRPRHRVELLEPEKRRLQQRLDDATSRLSEAHRHIDDLRTSLKMLAPARSTVTTPEQPTGDQMDTLDIPRSPRRWRATPLELPRGGSKA